jgi:uncharacterized protein
MESLTWEDINAITDQLAQKILDSAYQSNLIVAVARGGFIPARLLSSRLQIQRMSSIGITYQGSDRTTRIIYSVPTPIGNSDRILLVEDALETARSLSDAYEVLAQDAAEVRTAAYYYRPDSIVSPDFSLGMKSSIPKFPWE